MIVTIEWMEEWFRRFDQEYFGGKLPVPELGLTHAKTRLGQLAYKRASRWGRTKLYDFKLSMSTYYDMTDKQAKSVLLHEMIHYIIGYTGLKDTSAHGVVFKGLMDKLNGQYGWEIELAIHQSIDIHQGLEGKRNRKKQEREEGTANLSDACHRDE